MNYGYLSDYFKGVAIKTLSTVETDPSTSNQHEYNGVHALKRLFGTPIDSLKIPTKFVYLGSDEHEQQTDEGFLTWYDARTNHPTRSEYRCYYSKTNVSERANTGDMLLIAATNDGEALVLIVDAASSLADQVLWLFGIKDIKDKFEIRDDLKTDHDQIGLAATFILEQIGIEVEFSNHDYLDTLLDKFGANFPSTKVFSEFARSTLPEIHSQEDPDHALIEWMTQEELLFRTLEKHIVGARLESGFCDVETFVKYSLSVQNRRKSRVGYAFENHLAVIFDTHKLKFSRTAVTENKSKPDFLFPGQKEYEAIGYPLESLVMLGAKSTCKDRWRQVLSEAEKIAEKHLVTLQPAISEPQTSEMKSARLQLVVPTSIQASYTKSQRGWLMSMQEFISLVVKKQTTTQRQN